MKRGERKEEAVNERRVGFCGWKKLKKKRFLHVIYVGIMLRLRVLLVILYFLAYIYVKANWAQLSIF